MKACTLAWRTGASLVLLLSYWTLLLTQAWAATVLSGNVSGTWTPNGNPYILSADCTVASDQTLTIKEGTSITILPNVSLRVSGGIFAVGTPQQPITFAGASPSNYWNRIQISNSAFTNRFAYCKFSEGDYGLHLYVDADRTVVTEILNSTFRNFYGSCIWGQAEAPGSGSAILAPQIHNNVFENAAFNFCEFYNRAAGRAFMNPVVTANIFRNSRPESSNDRGLVLGTSLGLGTIVYGTNKSSPVIANNIFTRCSIGVMINSTNFVPIIRNNIFFANKVALEAYNLFGYPGATTEIKFNCLFQNAKNFDYFPGAFGLPLIANNNGTPCDVFYNIFVDPNFTDTNTYRLANNSPSIDAGDPTIPDVCFAISRGSTISDIGAYGGPDACGWLRNGFAPIIVDSPSDQSTCVGEGARFKVSAVGTAPLSYRWYFNPTDLLVGETNSQMNLVNLQPNHAGPYSVAVSNAFGSVTSAPARLLVFDACVGIHLYAGLNITGIVGRTYNVEYVTNLAATNWTFVASNTFSTPQWLFIDTNTPVEMERFFRVRLQP